MAAIESIHVEVAPGELIDKITILQIKSERIQDEAKLKNVRTELSVLEEALHSAVPTSPELTKLTSDLKKVNESLWVIEDDIRLCERDRDFGDRFVQLARSVYKTNDQRAELKYAINQLLGSNLIEEKDYEDYS